MCVWAVPACGSAANHQGAPSRPCCHFPHWAAARSPPSPISRRSGSARTFARSFSSSTVQADGVGVQNHVTELGGRSNPVRLGPDLHAGPRRDRNHRFRTSGEPGRRHIQSFRTRTRLANQGGSSTEGLSRVSQLIIESIQQEPD